MGTATISQLRTHLAKYLRHAKQGESTTILHRGQPVAQIIPNPPSVPKELEELAAKGLARLPLRALPADFWKRPRARSSASVVDALLEDRGRTNDD